MTQELILASGSEIRAQMLRSASIPVRIVPARIDETAIRAALEAEDAPPRDVADTLAEMKARKVAEKNPDALVLGCDQVLSFQGRIMSKPRDREDALTQLRGLRGERHELLSAAVLYEASGPVWRHVGVARLRMRDISDSYLEDYVARNWDSIRHSVGGYKLEEEGVRLFSRIDGDHFTVLGLPLLDLINHLVLRGTLAA